MLEIALTAAISLLVNSTPMWLPPIRDAFLNKGAEKGAELAIDKGFKGVRALLHLDEKEQRRHLELALKNAAERGLGRFHTQQEQDEYRDMLEFLAQSGPNSDALRREAMRLFTLTDSPNFTTLTEKYNDAQHTEIDAAPYLSSFFDALVAELYADPFFKQQMSDVLKVRAAKATMDMQRSLADVVTTLRQIGAAIADDYTAEQFERDVQAYTEHIERTFRYLKLVGVVPKDRGEKNPDPELDGIFVPLRIALQDQAPSEEEKQDSIIALLEQYPYVVLLGGPGSGKSTAVRHLTWSHAVANQSSVSSIPLLSGKPLPLRIELRRLTEDRRQHPDYNFLSYATEVLLGREGVEINAQMFKGLLERRIMLLLFDGLDEVATLDERMRLVEEIEHFALCYPGNRIIVTSRPVGYELASFSSQWFSPARVQEFNDEQIRQFLERWYTHVLRLSPIPQEDRQELETLFTALKDNQRLHKLAENPLLLTVITALHRYERLPDRRILVYDRCADLLLDTWAKLRGTDARWKDMKLVKEDQYACIAYLGFVLHERSQEKREDRTETAPTRRSAATNDAASDVSTRVMLREIEHFLSNRKLITDVAAQRAEAKHFLELMQVEAGLIVERGTGESDEILYGFVHRTFQEYFAAADVYERYQQEEDPAIISEFLKEHLHDPHWREVILLLLSKLKRKPATAQLRQIFEGKIKSRRSRYRDVVQQDLFFVSACLIEEIAVENELAEAVVSRLSDVVKNSPFPSQCTQALGAFGSLMQTRQYASLACKELIAFATKDVLPDLFSRRIEAARVLYRSSPAESEEKKQAVQMLMALAQRSDVTVEQAIEAAQALYFSSPTRSEERKQAEQMLTALAQRSDVTVEQAIEAAQVLYESSPTRSEERKQAEQMFTALAQRSDVTVEQAIQVAQALAALALYDSHRLGLASELEEGKQAGQMLLRLARRPDVTVEQAIQAAQALYFSSPTRSEERKQAEQMLTALAQRSDVTVEQTIQAAQALYLGSPTRSEERKQTEQMLLRLAQRPDLTVEQAIQAAQVLYNLFNFAGSEETEQTEQMLLRLAQRPDLTVEQAIQAAQVLYQSRPAESEEGKQAAQMLMTLAQRPDVTVEQTIQAAQALYLGSPTRSEEEKQVAQRLWQLAEDQTLGVNQRLQAAVMPLMKWDANYADKAQAVQIVLSLLEGEAAGQYLEEHWLLSFYGEIADISGIPYIAELAKQELLPIRARNEMYQILRDMVPQFDKVDVAGG